MKAKLSNVFMCAVIALTWCCILFAVYIISVISDIYKYFGEGIIKYVAVLLFIMAALLPILFYKKIKTFYFLSVAYICTAILSFVLFCAILACARGYISSFTGEKWLNNEKLRIYMINDLEREYSIVGKSQSDIWSLLGQPTYISENEVLCYEYYVGDSLIDPITYDIVFVDGIAVSTTLTEH